MAWEDVALPGAAVTGCQAVYYNGKIYIAANNAVRIYNIGTNSWSSVAISPTIGYYNATTRIGNYIYIAGLETCKRMSLTDYSWTTLGTSSLPVFGNIGTDPRYFFNVGTRVILAFYGTQSNGYMGSIQYNNNISWSTSPQPILGGRTYLSEFPLTKGWYRGENDNDLRVYSSAMQDLSSYSGLQIGPTYTPFGRPVVGTTAAYGLYNSTNLRRWYYSDEEFTQGLSSAFGDGTGPLIWAAGFVYHWYSNGASGKRWTPSYKIAGDTQDPGVRVEVYRSSDGIFLGEIYSNSSADFVIGLETTDLVDVVAISPDTSQKALIYRRVTPVAY